jgi:hypothetical protein
MNFKERVNRALESLFLAMFMVWSVGIAVALLNPPTAGHRSGVVEVYSLTPVADSNAGA